MEGRREEGKITKFSSPFFFQTPLFPSGGGLREREGKGRGRRGKLLKNPKILLLTPPLPHPPPGGGLREGERERGRGERIYK